MSFTSNAYHPGNKEFIPMDELIETNEFQNLTTAFKTELYLQNDTDYTESDYSAIICKGDQVAAVSSKYELVLHENAFINVVNTLNKAGINMQGRVNDFGKTAWLDMVFENMKITDPSGSEVNLGYSVRNSYDRSSGLNIFPFAVRGICSNGMIFNETPKLKGLMDIISVSHMGEVLSRLGNRLKGLIQNTLQIEGVFIEMLNQADNDILHFSSEKELELTIASFKISEKRVKEALARGSINLENCSKFELYNCLTEYATWTKLSPGLYETVQFGATKLLTEPLSETENRIKIAAEKILA